MQALLSFEQSPPLRAPLRFFMTAPLFGMLAGALLLWGGPDLLASRWTPGVLALTHLITVGFMLQVMLGALQQLLPVVAGANMARPLRVALVVHACLTVGTLVLVAAFLSYRPWLFGVATLLLGLGVLTFIVSATRALIGVASDHATVGGIKLALLGLGITLTLGLVLAIALAGSYNLPLLSLTTLHLGWGLLGWGGVLVAAVGYVVVPMFQLTPPYPDWFTRHFARVAIGIMALWMATELGKLETLSTLLATAATMAGATLAGTTLTVARRSKRARLDPTQQCWRLAMACTLLASALWVATRFIAPLEAWPQWPLLWGVLVLFGGFVSVMVGMLYKIVPFLVWLHLRNLGRGKVSAPNMKMVLAESDMRQHLWLHGVALLALVLAVIWPDPLVYPAAVALIAANTWLLRNLLRALGVYHRHLLVIANSPPTVHHA
ncbi:MAG: hypothetical protein IPF55_13245 [Rhodoferax sp.]|nr:hypothetical protein [Rhodoferax sp.]